MPQINSDHTASNATQRDGFELSGPITGGLHGRPHLAYLGDILDVNYIEEEFFLVGTATRFAPVGELDLGGRWEVEPAGAAPFKTRILIRRPANPMQFNGTVIVEWLNVSTGCEIPAVIPNLYEGYAYAGVSAQFVGIHGFPSDPQGLIAWDGERYESLHHPGDSYSYDVFTQAARAVRSHVDWAQCDPLPGVEVKTLIAVGGSQSGCRLVTYANALESREGAFDAIMPLLVAGIGAKFDDFLWDRFSGGDVVADLMQQAFAPTVVRADLKAPVLMLNSEFEAVRMSRAQMRPDSATFRYWEVAGAPHLSPEQADLAKRLFERDGLRSLASRSPSDDDGRRVSHTHVLEAALGHVVRWVQDGTVPPSFLPIAKSGEPEQIQRDRFGNAQGGIRLPDMDVPLAQNWIPASGVFEELSKGARRPLTDEQLSELYSSQPDYVVKVRRAAESAVAAGVLTESRANKYVEEAESTSGLWSVSRTGARHRREST